MKVYSRRRKLALLEMLEMLLEKGDELYLDNFKFLVTVDEVENKKYMVVDDTNIIPYDKFFKCYKDSDVLTELFTDVYVKSKSDNISTFFEKFFN